MEYYSIENMPAIGTKFRCFGRVWSYDAEEGDNAQITMAQAEPKFYSKALILGLISGSVELNQDGYPIE